VLDWRRRLLLENRELFILALLTIIIIFVSSSPPEAILAIALAFPFLLLFSFIRSRYHGRHILDGCYRIVREDRERLRDAIERRLVRRGIETLVIPGKDDSRRVKGYDLLVASLAGVAWHLFLWSEDYVTFVHVGPYAVAHLSDLGMFMGAVDEASREISAGQ